MANEVQVNSGLTVTFPTSTGGLNYAPYRRQHSFNRTLTSTRGPTPGALQATTTGVQISLAQLTTPGVGWIQNNSTQYWLEIGTKDTSSGNFTPLLEIGPGEGYAMCLTRQLGSELTGGAGSGTAGSGCVLWAKGITGTVDFSAEFFDR